MSLVSHNKISSRQLIYVYELLMNATHLNVGTIFVQYGYVEYILLKTRYNGNIFTRSFTRLWRSLTNSCIIFAFSLCHPSLRLRLYRLAYIKIFVADNNGSDHKLQILLSRINHACQSDRLHTFG